MTEVLQ